MEELVLGKKMKIILILLAILNIVTIISKNTFNPDISCSSCHIVPYLGISESTLGILGIGANLILAIIVSLYNRHNFKGLAVFISFCFSSFSVFLQIMRYYTFEYQRFCAYCLASTAIFIIIFIVLFNYSITHKVKAYYF